MVHPVVLWLFWSRRLSLPVKGGICPLPLVRRMIFIVYWYCCYSVVWSRIAGQQYTAHAVINGTGTDTFPTSNININIQSTFPFPFPFTYRPSLGHCSSFFIKHQQKKSVSSCGLLLFMFVRYRVACCGWPRGCWSFRDLFRCLLGADGL